MAKSRIAPRERVTLPRLELIASLLSARVRHFVLQRLDVKVDRVVHYTDSAVAFFWIIAEQPTRFKTFVCNRILEIQQLSSPKEWFHVAGKSNIADVATRGVSAESLISNSVWLNGSSWLSKSREDRPVKRLQSG